MKPSIALLIAAAGITIFGFSSLQSGHELIPISNGEEFQSGGDLRINWQKKDSSNSWLIFFACISGSTILIRIALSQLESEKPTPQNIQAANSPKKTPSIFIDNTQELQSVTEMKDNTKVIYEPTVDTVLVPQQIIFNEPTKSEIDSTLEIFEAVKNHDGHLLIPAITGAGKTTFLLALIEYLHKTGKVQFCGSDPKNSPFMGLENEPFTDGQPAIIRLSLTQPDSILKLVKRLEHIKSIFEARSNQRLECNEKGIPYNPTPLYVILEEWIVTLAIAESYDPAVRDSLKAQLNLLSISTREDKIFFWVFGQDHQVQNCGINKGYQKNYGAIIPARNGNFQAIEDAISGMGKLVSVKAKGEELHSALAQYASKKHIPVAYSNLGGHKIYELPNLPKQRQKRLFANQKPSLQVINGGMIPQESKPIDRELPNVWD